jgi:large subunit ribosomal protein L15
MMLHDVNRGIRPFKKRRRIGRGPGSGHGKTAGRGHKGAKSRAGYSRKPTFQGGAMPMVRRVPKRGFNNKFAITVQVINVGDLEIFDNGSEVNLESLNEKSLAKGRFDQLKVLGNGDLTKKLQVAAHRFSKSAQEKIEKAGGEVVIVPGPTPVKVKQKLAKAAKKAAQAK